MRATDWLKARVFDVQHTKQVDKWIFIMSQRAVTAVLMKRPPVLQEAQWRCSVRKAREEQVVVFQRLCPGRERPPRHGETNRAMVLPSAHFSMHPVSSSSHSCMRPAHPKTHSDFCPRHSHQAVLVAVHLSRAGRLEQASH